MEARGNKNLFLNGKNIGTKQMSSTLHWGPDSAHNGYENTNYVLNTPNGKGFDNDFRVYRMDWTSGKVINIIIIHNSFVNIYFLIQNISRSMLMIFK